MDAQTSARELRQASAPPLRPRRYAGYLWAVGAVTICTVVAWAMVPLVAEATLIMVYLLGVMLIAVRIGQGPALLASALSVLAFDMSFVPPYLSLAVNDARYLVTFWWRGCSR
jgi:two-component system sensor histidine kinase KdpD